MRKMLLLATLSVVALLHGCAPLAPPRAGVTPEAEIVRTVIPGPSLDGDMAADETPLNALVYLPPSYRSEPGRRYPLLVLLHGYWSSPEQWEDGAFSLKAAFDSTLRAGSAKEMIVVMPAGANALGGAFYVNGTASGDWEDYVARDVVAFADRTYRTIGTRRSRGIAGHSMGGYGALSIASRRPDVFSAVYAMSPCCGDLVGDFAMDSPAWRSVDSIRSPADFEASSDFYGRVLIALGAAWSPDAAAPLHAGRPVSAGIVNPDVVAKWQKQTLTSIVAAHADALRSYSAIGMDVGDRDDFSHIRRSVPALSQQMRALGIEHEFRIYAGDHVSGIDAQMREHVLPFFSKHLSTNGN
jgi:S-formylglutathione hydrolase